MSDTFGPSRPEQGLADAEGLKVSNSDNKENSSSYVTLGWILQHIVGNAKVEGTFHIVESMFNGLPVFFRQRVAELSKLLNRKSEIGSCSNGSVHLETYGGVIE